MKHLKWNLVLLTITMLFIFSGCRDKHYEYYDSGKPREIIEVDKNTGKPDGSYKEFYENGNLKVEGNFKEGKQHGSYKKYYSNGEIHIKGSYKDGELDGVRKTYYKNGELEKKEKYKAGKLHGSFKSYYENGELNVKTSYTNDTLDGDYEKYDDKGQLRIDASLKKGLLTGSYKEYYSNGKSKIETEFKDGQMVDGQYRSYYDNGKKKVFSTIKNEALNGPFEAYSKNGTLMAKGEFENGQFVHKEFFTDSRDGQKYPITTIGNQTWMASNLNYKMQHSGCLSQENNGVCENNLRTYTRSDAVKACPDGWRLPSEDDFTKLLKFVQDGNNLDVAYTFEHPVSDEGICIPGLKLKNLNGVYMGEKSLLRKRANGIGAGSGQCHIGKLAPYLLISGEYVSGYDIYGFSAYSKTKLNGMRSYEEYGFDKEVYINYWTSSKSVYDHKQNKFVETSGHGENRYLQIEGFDKGNIGGWMGITHCVYHSFSGSNNNNGDNYGNMFVRCVKDGDGKGVENSNESDNALETMAPTAEKKQDTPVGESMTDSRDGKTYKTVKIGNRVWMAENLNFKSADSWCYDNSEQNCNEYGRLYSWNAAQKACPSGWRMASDSEWGSVAGNSTSFGIKTAGFRNAKGKFELLGKRADFWTADDAGDKGKYHYYSASAGTMDKNAYSKKGAMSVRCIQASACDDIDWDLFQGDSPSAEAYRAGLEEKGCVSSK